MRHLYALLLLSLSLVAWAFPLDSPAFATLVKDSYQEVPGAPPFRAWWDAAYRHAFGESLQEALHREAKAPPLEAATWAFQVIKRLLPRFSLEEGYEFAYAARKGERQCLLQAVLVQGLLEGAGFRAGVYMVYENPEGKRSNLGHAVAVLRLAGRDYLVDPSEPTPFPRHRGLLVVTAKGLRFAEPQYSGDGAILAYRTREGTLSPKEVEPLSFAYVRSQFYYYRGEQAKGGVLRGPRSPEGLARSEAMLRKAVALAPENPLAVYLLGLTLGKEGKESEAKAALLHAAALYQAYGWVPPGVEAALKRL
ncbi:hypothetical protein [Thermus thalpophilus]|uniref:hypothetical protein n=1 Tax=Thermus thalpophilus TaxID=2908147 RepID=UPI001FA94823|nr:hypothetical protein [Thermus thalpophilus]